MKAILEYNLDDQDDRRAHLTVEIKYFFVIL